MLCVVLRSVYVGGAVVNLVQVGAGAVLDASQHLERALTARAVLPHDWTRLQRIISQTSPVNK